MGEGDEARDGELDIITVPLAMVSKATGERLLALLRAGAGRPVGGKPSATPRLAVRITMPTRAVAEEIAKVGKVRAQMQRAFEAQPEMHARIIEMIEKMSAAAGTEGGSFAGRQFVVSLAAISSP